MNTEAIMQALFAKVQALQTAGTIAYASRRMQHWDGFNAANCPAVFQLESDIDVLQERHKPAKFTYTVEWWVYVAQPDDSQPMTPPLNAILDALITSLTNAADPSGDNTLNGLVQRAYVSGKVEIAEGALTGGLAVAVIPLTILAI